MSKLIEQSQPQTLKICYGNDFSLNVSVNIWDADTSAWSKLDLSAASDVELFLVAQNGKRIKTTSSIEQDGSLVAQIPSTYLSKTLYSIEITFRMDGRNRRTYSPCMIQIVNSTDEAGASVSDYVTNDAYHFDIMIKNDVAWLNIGSLPKEYVTEEELDNVLVSYVKTEVLDSTLENYATTQYVDDAISDIDLTDYYTKSEVDTTLNSYGTSLSKGIKIIPGPSIGMDINLNSNTQSLSTLTIPSFQKHNNSSVPKGWEISPDTLMGFVLKSTVETIYDTVDDVNSIMSDYITSTSLNSALSDYYTQSQVDTMLSDYVNDAEYDSTNHNILLKNGSNTIATIDASPFIVDGMVDNVEIVNGNLVISFNTDAGKQDISIPISQIFDASNYYTKSEVDAALANIDLSSYVTTDDLSSAGYVTSTELTNAGYVTETYVSSYVDSLDSRVTYLEEHQGGDVDLSAYVTYNELDNYTYTIATALTRDRQDILNTYTYFNNYYTKTESDSRYTTLKDLKNIFTEQSSFNDATYTTAAGLCDLDSRVAYLEEHQGEGGGDVDLSAYVAYVDWDNTNEAIAYELLSNRLDHMSINDNFSNYYTKTEADSRYATSSWANNRFVTQSDDVNRQQAIAYAISYLNDNIGQGGSAPSNMVTTDTAQTITARKTFSDEVAFNSADQSISFVDNANGIRKTGKMARGAFNQAVIGQIWAPSTAATDNTWNCTNQVNTIKFQCVDANGSDIKNPTLHQLAKIDTTGIYEGTTLLANKYVQSSYIRNIVQISQSDYDLLTPDSNTLYIIL